VGDRRRHAGERVRMMKGKFDKEMFGQELCDLLVLDEASQMNLPERSWPHCLEADVRWSWSAITARCRRLCITIGSGSTAHIPPVRGLHVAVRHPSAAQPAHDPVRGEFPAPCDDGGILCGRRFTDTTASTTSRGSVTCCQQPGWMSLCQQSCVLSFR